jgi:hypothetical protein
MMRDSATRVVSQDVDLAIPIELDARPGMPDPRPRGPAVDALLRRREAGA